MPDLSFELSFEDETYLVELLEGSKIIIFKVTSAVYADYAKGTWSPLGGYGRYLFDNERSSYNWKLLDLIDETLRKKTDFCPQLPSSIQEVQQALSAILT